MVSACHDVSDGGLLVAVAEMAIAGQMGCAIDLAPETDASFWFGEDQARYVVTTDSPDAFASAAEQAGVPVQKLGITHGTDLAIDGLSVSVAELTDANESWLPTYMDA